MRQTTPQPARRSNVVFKPAETLTKLSPVQDFAAGDLLGRDGRVDLGVQRNRVIDGGRS
ncbi:hypothetical protein ACFYO2_36510 [Streptomyces sp. NPDC006602]|uniref:hypothetical protein n=1 Tax=Streptomyces sp. NPDC006602 TaxID=3364751 RepID=UPI0036887111